MAALIEDILVDGSNVNKASLRGYLAGQGFISVKDPVFGAIGDGVAADAAAIQAAWDAAVADSLGIVWHPAGSYDLDTTSLTVGAGAMSFVGAGDSTIFKYSGTSAAIKNSGTTTRRDHLRFENFAMELQADDGICIDFTYFSYSYFHHLSLGIYGNDTRGFYGTSSYATSTPGPYYNRWMECHIASNNINGVTSGAVGYYFDRVLVDGQWQGPNACTVDGGRISGGEEHIVIKAGRGNNFLNIRSESAQTNHVHLGDTTTPEDTGTATSAGGSSLTDSGKSWTTNLYANGAINITAGTGSGQWRPIAANTGTQITVHYPWATVPDNTSEYRLFINQGFENTFRDWYVEGASGSNFVSIEPPVAATKVHGGTIASLGAGRIINADTVWPGGDVFKPSFLQSSTTFWFSGSDIAANQTDASMGVRGKEDVLFDLPPGRWSLMGIRVISNASITVGSFTAWAIEESTKLTDISAQLTAAKPLTAMNFLPTGQHVASSSQRRIACKYSTSSDFAPTTAEIMVGITVAHS